MSHQDLKQSCSQCRYFERQDIKQGICRRFPPQIFVLPFHTQVGLEQLAIQVASRFASVQTSMWCGEFMHPGPNNTVVDLPLGATKP